MFKGSLPTQSFTLNNYFCKMALTSRQRMILANILGREAQGILNLIWYLNRWGDELEVSHIQDTLRSIAEEFLALQQVYLNLNQLEQ